MGVEVHRANTISGWIIEHILKAVVDRRACPGNYF